MSSGYFVCGTMPLMSRTYAGVHANKNPDHKWSSGIMRVYFFNGTEEQREFVVNVANEWFNARTSNYAPGKKDHRIISKFEISNFEEDAQVRVEFCDVSETLIGVHEVIGATMHLKFHTHNNPFTLAWRRYEVLHQFGHVLGMQHPVHNCGVYKIHEGVINAYFRKYYVDPSRFVSDAHTVAKNVINDYHTSIFYRNHLSAQYETAPSVMFYPMDPDWIESKEYLDEYPLLFTQFSMPPSELTETDKMWACMVYAESTEYPDGLNSLGVNTYLQMVNRYVREHKMTLLPSLTGEREFPVVFLWRDAEAVTKYRAFFELFNVPDGAIREEKERSNVIVQPKAVVK